MVHLPFNRKRHMPHIESMVTLLYSSKYLGQGLRESRYNLGRVWCLSPFTKGGESVASIKTGKVGNSRIMTNRQVTNVRETL